MKFSARLRFGAVYSVLVGAAIGIGFYVTRGEPAPAAATALHESAPAPAASLRPLPAIADEVVACTKAPTTPQASSPSTAAAAPAPERIRRVLPSMQEAVADWRLFAPERLTVEAVPGKPIEFECVELKRGGPNGEYSVWIGRAPGIPGATFVGVGARDRWIGTQVVPGAHEYLLAVVGSEVTVIEKPDGYCSTPLAVPATQPVVLPAALAAASTPVALAADTPALWVDVVFFYGDDVSVALADIIDGNGTVAEFATFLAAASIEQINQMLAQSGVTNFRWRLAGTEKVPAYPKKYTVEDELRAFLDSTIEPGKTASARLAEIGADQGVLWLWDDHPNSPTVVGIATTPGRASVIYLFMPDILVAHELAHNFGCRHDRQTSDERNEGAQNGDGQYFYGYRFTRDGIDCGTIMSYASNRIPYFSNPDNPVGGAVYSTNWTGPVPTGLPATDSRAADNARWLREQAATLAATRELVTAPAITTQPAGTTITAGETLRITVVATGGNLSYQWQKGGVDVAGKTAATYTQYGTTSADSGSYTVTVRNNLGSVASTSAMVTVNPAPAPSKSSGGSSGGGGALPIWFVTALVALGAARRILRPAAGTN